MDQITQHLNLEMEVFLMSLALDWNAPYQQWWGNKLYKLLEYPKAFYATNKSFLAFIELPRKQKKIKRWYMVKILSAKNGQSATSK